MFYLILYVVIACICNCFALYLSVKSFRKKTSLGKNLAVALLMSIFISTFYLIGVFSSNDMVSSVFNSLYFISLDVLLIYFFAFMFHFCGYKVKNKKESLLLSLLYSYSAVDFVVLVLNPFLNHFAVDYIPNNVINDKFIIYSYDMKPLYIAHLIYCYILSLCIIIALVRRCMEVPKEYKGKYRVVLYGIFAIVVLNGIYLYLPKEGFNVLDFSLFIYAVGGFLIYLGTFNSFDKSFVNALKALMFEKVGHGLILFDYKSQLIVANDKAKSILKNISLDSKITLFDVLRQANIHIDEESLKEDRYSIQCYLKNEDTTTPLRVDYRKVINKNDDIIGYLISLENTTNETDLLTGFQNFEDFKFLAKENPAIFEYPVTICIVDIIGLAIYNEINGFEQGNELIKTLADELRIVFPKDRYFVRGKEASLIVILKGLKEKYAIERLDDLKSRLKFKFKYACLEAKDKNIALNKYINKTFDGLNVKKLLDKNSAHSTLISSLVKALQEADEDTESHVVRTQSIGTALGKTLGLSDVELSNLSLLCLLHDIGKIGVPLEILNKPSRLTDEEFEVVKSHAEKGYNIALASPELKSIAIYIKHHHEKWDGSGYPDGLSRESIPLLSRMVAVIDAFDAMVSDRVYRKALSIEKAKNEIRRNAGTQFDPHIASTFLKMIDENDFYKQQKDDHHEVVENKPIIEIKDNTSTNVFNVIYSRYVLNFDNSIDSCDDNFLKFTGYTKEDIHNKKLTQLDLIPDEDKVPYITLVNEKMANSDFAYFEHPILKKDGTIKSVLCFGRKFYDSVTRLMKSEIVIVDVLSTNTIKVLTEELDKKSLKRLHSWEEKYRKDALTQLLTRQAFQNDVEETLIANDKVQFLMLDLDKFKKYNDSYGHQKGDQFLIEFSSAMRKLYSQALICRMGGDEFAIAFINEEKTIEETVLKVHTQLTSIIQSISQEVFLSIGAVESNEEINTFNEIYAHADKALYDSKNNGRNKYTIYKG